MVAHIPHASRFIPVAFREQLVLDETALNEELLLMTDAHTDLLDNRIMTLGGTGFINIVSRLVVDLERFPDDSQEVMAARGMGAVYRITGPIRR